MNIKKNKNFAGFIFLFVYSVITKLNVKTEYMLSFYDIFFHFYFEFTCFFLLWLQNRKHNLHTNHLSTDESFSKSV
jgi:hypothetical protein